MEQYPSLLCYSVMAAWISGPRIEPGVAKAEGVPASTGTEEKGGGESGTTGAHR